MSTRFSLLVAILTLQSLQKLGDGVPEVKRSDIEQRGYGGFRGGRGGRGFRGGFASRGLSAAGLVRGGAPKTNGDA
jgi:hypothetical protein